MGVVYQVKVLSGEGSSSRSLRQGCPSRGGIWRKPAANFRPEEHESHEASGSWMSLQCKAKPMLPKAAVG